MIEDIKNKVINYFERSNNLRVLFFFDEQQEFKTAIDDLAIPEITLLKWEDNPFTLKVRLTDELKDKKILLYLPIKQPSTKDEYQNFPLMGLLIANKELQLDDVGDFMEEFGVGRHQKALIQRYISELKYASVKTVCQPILASQNLTENALQQGILSALLKFKQIKNWPLLIAKLATLPLNEAEHTKVIKKITGLAMVNTIVEKVKQLLNVSISDLSLISLKLIGQTLRYNQITQTISSVKPSDPYVSLKIKNQEKITQLNQLLFAIETDATLNQQIQDLFIQIDEDIKGERIIEVYGIDQEYATYSVPMLWCIITQTLHHLFDNSAHTYKVLEKLSLQNGLTEEVTATVSFLSQTAKLIQYIETVKSYILNTPDDYIKWYEKEGYLIDQFYRRSISARKLIDDSELPDTIQFDDIVKTLNELYESHTDKLNREWLKCLNENEFDYSKIKHPKQYDFYNTEIKPIDQKVVVIISDALRYEAGMELLSAMHGDPKNTAEVRSMIASLPSKTNVGMAQLLPGNDLIFNEGSIKNDSFDTSGIPNRAKILQQFNAESNAVKYTEIEELHKVDRTLVRSIFKNQIVYVYHDVIDARGDKKVSERETFSAVGDAVNQLKKFVKLLHGSYNVAKVYITADHGFLYSDTTIQEKNLEKIEEANAISTHNRYIISKEASPQDLGYTFPLSKTTKFKDNLFVTIPKSINRYRKQGVGHQFVHGGGSLQELIVPLIESSRKRVDISTKVTPQLVSNQNLRVVSNVLRFNLLQKEPVSRLQKELTLSIGLYNDLELVSNEDIKLMNFTSDSPSERMLRIELVLAAHGANNAFLKLKIFDIDDKLNPLIEETIQNNTLIQADF